MNGKIELKQIFAFQKDKFHILPTLSKSSLNKFDISDLSPTQAGISFKKAESPFLYPSEFVAR
jgi:hypothetical protein